MPDQYPELQDPDIQQQYPELQDPDVVQPGQDPQTPISSNVVDPSQFQQPTDYTVDNVKTFNANPTWDRIGANVQAGVTGIMELGSSIAKIADKIGLAPKGTAKKAQNIYNDAEKIYQAGTYPETAISKIAGTTAIPGVGLPVKVGAKLGEVALGKFGQYLGAGIGGSAAGGLTGGLLNTQGNSPEDTFNEHGATMGAILGAPLGVAGNLVGNWGKTTAAYQTAKEEAKQLGIKAPVLARDSNEPAIAAVKSAWMDNIITTGIRNEQLQAITPAVKQLLTGLTSEERSSHRVGQVIRGINNRLDNEVNTRWTDLLNSAKEAGISKIDTPTTKAATTDFLNEYGQFISKKDMGVLQTLSQAKQVDFGALNRVKGSDIWKMSEKFGKMEGSTNENISNALKDIYWNITDDIGNTLKAKPELETTWHATKAFTSGVKELFNVQNNRKLVTAIDDINENTGHLKTFINSITSPVSSKQTDYYNKALGPSYQNAAEKAMANKIFTESFNTQAKGLNLGKFFKDANTAKEGHLMNNDTVKAIGGLEQFFNTVQTAQMSKSKAAQHIGAALPYAQTIATSGGFYAGGVPGAVASAAAVFGGPKLLSWVSRTSPVKNLLIGLSKVYGKNPQTTEHIMKLIGNKLSAAGAVITHDDTGIKADLQ